MEGPDHKASLDSKELKDVIKAIKNKDYFVSIDEKLILGKSEKKPVAKEKDMIKLIRKSIVAKRNIKKEKIITGYMIIIKRPGIGIQPRFIDKVIGRKTKREIKEDTLISMEDLV